MGRGSGPDDPAPPMAPVVRRVARPGVAGRVQRVRRFGRGAVCRLQAQPRQAAGRRMPAMWCGRRPAWSLSGGSSAPPQHSQADRSLSVRRHGGPAGAALQARWRRSRRTLACPRDGGRMPRCSRSRASARGVRSVAPGASPPTRLRPGAVVGGRSCQASAVAPSLRHPRPPAGDQAPGRRARVVARGQRARRVRGRRQGGDHGATHPPGRRRVHHRGHRPDLRRVAAGGGCARRVGAGCLRKLGCAFGAPTASTATGEAVGVAEPVRVALACGYPGSHRIA